MPSILSSLRNLLRPNVDTEKSHPPPPLTLIAGPDLVFNVEAVKRGGMGIVYICNIDAPNDDKYNQRIALKTFDERFFFNVDMSLAVASESALWIRVSDQPFIFPVISTLTIDQKPYLVMPVAEPDQHGNVSLADTIKQNPEGLRAAACLKLGLCLSIALSAAAEAVPGLIHGDIKPDNILFLGGSPLLADFGLARLGEKAGRCGTPAFMAPELWTAEGSTNVKTDVYAFGMTLYQTMTGSLPFPNVEANPERWLEVHSSIKPSFNEGDGGSSPLAVELRNLILKCLAKSPADRFEDFDEIKSELFLIGMTHDAATTFEVMQTGAGLVSINNDQKVSTAQIRVSNFLAQGEFKAALEVLSTLTESQLTGELLLLAGSTYSLNDDDEKALNYFERFLETDPAPEERLRCLSETGLSLRRLNRLNEAKELFEKLMEEATGQQRVTVRGNYAAVLLDLDQIAEGLRELQWLTRNHPDSPEGWALYSRALQRSGEDEKARAAIQAAIQRAPRNGNYYISLGDLLLRLRRPNEALAALDKAYGLGFHTRSWVKLTLATSLVLNRLDDVAGLVLNLKTQLSEAEVKGVMDEALELANEILEVDPSAEAPAETGDQAAAARDLSNEPDLNSSISEYEPPETADSPELSESEVSADEHMNRVRSGKQPHAQVRMSFVDGSFAIDFYYDVNSSGYPETFKLSYTQAKWRLETTSGAERDQRYRFAQCQNCQFILLTARDDGERFACQACGQRGPVTTIRSEHLDNLLRECEKAIGRNPGVVAVEGVTLLVAFWIDDLVQAEAISKRMASEGFVQAAPDAGAFAYFQMQMINRGVELAGPVTQVWSKSLSQAEEVIAERTPAFLDRIIRDLRRETGKSFQSVSEGFVASGILEFLLANPAGQAKLARELVAENPEDHAAKAALVTSELRAGNIVEAKRLAAAMELLDPTDFHALRAAAEVALAEERPEDAIWRLERIVEASPRDKAARVLLINACDAAGDKSKADDHLAQYRAMGGK